MAISAIFERSFKFRLFVNKFTIILGLLTCQTIQSVLRNSKIMSNPGLIVKKMQMKSLHDPPGKLIFLSKSTYFQLLCLYIVQNVSRYANQYFT